MGGYSDLPDGKHNSPFSGKGLQVLPGVPSYCLVTWTITVVSFVDASKESMMDAVRVSLE